ncbi:MAG: right-handed parallel beta-helix repeat-containing protein [Alphaproteobacteria bacterium]|nr:right-handed parallel beta-helix repeat-containing protein [Alphaproteobacteria bacterium]
MAAGPAFSAVQFGVVGDGKADDTAALEAGLNAAFGGRPGILTIPAGVYRVTRTIRVLMTAGGDAHTGVRAYGAHFVSSIEDGGNVFEFVNRAETRLVLMEGLDILGTHRDGHGIYIDSQSGPGFGNFCLRDIVVQYCGGDGAHLVGNVSEGEVTNSYFRNNRGNGVTFSDGQRAGTPTALHVFGCVCGDNGRHGAALTGTCSDVAFHGCYFLQSGAFGLSAENGCTLLSNCGFENNWQAAPRFAAGNGGLYLGNFGTLVACMGYSMLKQGCLVHAELRGPLVMVGCSGYGSAEAKAAGLAVLAGGAAATATLVGCSGSVSYEDGFEGVEIGGAAAGIKLGANWRSRALPRLGDYRLWIDAHGRLRLKKGVPTADDDGAIVGT